ncbi:HNH endonuclease, partial [Nostoc sp. CCCryo 231-06]|nr:HNH endonuclease [Nostoc sp. CCCryo 231-06]
NIFWAVFIGFFLTFNTFEIDHIIPKSKGGKNEYKNIQLLHRHCHDEKTARDGSLGTKSDCNSVKPTPIKLGNRGINENDLITEEPDEVKVSRPVLVRESLSLPKSHALKRGIVNIIRSCNQCLLCPS